MKIAAISDIHSNVYALESVLENIRNEGVDVIVNLGDILYGPIAPRATYDCLMTNDCVTIRGNQDRQIYEAGAVEINANPTIKFILEDLGEEPLQWMKHLPFDRQLTDDIYLCHGTPTDDLVYLLEDVHYGSPLLRTEKKIIELLAGQVSPLILCGHTHIPRTVSTRSGQLLVNPGSVGLPAYTDDLPAYHSMQNFSHHARYAVIEGKGRRWQVQHRCVEYDFRAAAMAAETRNRKDWVHFLSTGRGLS